MCQLSKTCDRGKKSDKIECIKHNRELGTPKRASVYIIKFKLNNQLSHVVSRIVHWVIRTFMTSSLSVPLKVAATALESDTKVAMDRARRVVEEMAGGGGGRRGERGGERGGRWGSK